MAESNPPRETAEESELEAELQAMREEKKAIFEKTRQHDENLWKITEKERQMQERLRQMRAEKVERDLRERYAAQKKTTVEEVGLQTELEALKCENDRINKKLVTLSNERMNAIAELKVLKTENEQLKSDRAKNMTELQGQNASLAELKKNLQHISSLSEAQQKTIKCWEDKFSAAQQVAVETQLRQLDELQSPTDETTELKQILTTQHQQQQPSVAEEHHQGKYYTACAKYFSIS